VRTVPLLRLVQFAGNSFQLPGSCHDRDSADLKFTKTYEAFNGILAAVVTDRVPAVRCSQMGIGTRPGLRHAEGHRTRREEKPAALRRADDGINGLKRRFVGRVCRYTNRPRAHTGNDSRQERVGRVSSRAGLRELIALRRLARSLVPPMPIRNFHSHFVMLQYAAVPSAKGSPNFFFWASKSFSSCLRNSA
jgi:hypothetical protein